MTVIQRLQRNIRGARNGFRDVKRDASGACGRKFAADLLYVSGVSSVLASGLSGPVGLEFDASGSLNVTGRVLGTPYMTIVESYVWLPSDPGHDSCPGSCRRSHPVSLGHGEFLRIGEKTAK